MTVINPTRILINVSWTSLIRKARTVVKMDILDSRLTIKQSEETVEGGVDFCLFKYTEVMMKYIKIITND